MTAPPPFVLPRGQRAYPKLPPFLVPIIDAAAEIARGQPWYVAWGEAMNFRHILEAAGNSGPPLSTEEVGHGRQALLLQITAMLERMGANPKKCKDPHQAILYRGACRRDFRKSAERYAQRAGGWDAVVNETVVWEKANEALIDTLPGNSPIQMGTEPAGENGVGTLEEFLAKWAARAREQFEAAGKLDPLAAGQLPDGSTVFLTAKTPRHQPAKRNFRVAAEKVFSQRGVIRRVDIAEVWMAEGEGATRPSKADNRQEAIVILAKEDGNELGEIITVERDWQTGEPTLGQSEQVTGASVGHFFEGASWELFRYAQCSASAGGCLSQASAHSETLTRGSPR